MKPKKEHKTKLKENKTKGKKRTEKKRKGKKTKYFYKIITEVITI